MTRNGIGRQLCGGGRQAAQTPQLRWVNTMPGNLKTFLAGAYHSFDHARYGARYLAEFDYRFNRRFHLAAKVPRLLRTAVQTQPPPLRVLRFSEAVSQSGDCKSGANLQEIQATAKDLFFHSLAVAQSLSCLTCNSRGLRQDWPRIPLAAAEFALTAGWGSGGQGSITLPGKGNPNPALLRRTNKTKDLAPRPHWTFA